VELELSLVGERLEAVNEEAFEVHKKGADNFSE
jgi:hypothetical protein